MAELVDPAAGSARLGPTASAEASAASATAALGVLVKRIVAP
jgi:hypothetical protein